MIQPQGALKKFLSFFTLLAILLLLPTLSTAEDEQTIEAAGMAPVTGSNTAIARDAAISDAMRKAVEQAVGSMVTAETLVNNYQVLSDNVYTKTAGYVRNYKVISESAAGPLYQVTIKATVASGNLKNDLDAIGLLHVKAEKPRILFMIAEQALGHKYYSFWWWGKSEYMGETVDISAAETALKETFINKGFNIVDISGSGDTIEISNAFKVADLTNDGARQIGRKLNAEIVVKGKALAKEGPRTPGSSVGSYIADVTATAIRVDTGEVVASSKGHGVARHISDVTGGTEAFSRAANELADRMIDQILAKWKAGGSITIRVSGVKDYKGVTDLKEMLKKRVKDVKAVYQRRFEGSQATFEIETGSPAHRVADELSAAGLKILNTGSNTIEVQAND